jgi:hypothetical protein
MADHRVEGEGVGHPGLVDHQQRLRPDRCGPLGDGSIVVDRPAEPSQGVGRHAGGRIQLVRGCGGGGQAENVAAPAGPRVGEHLQGGGLPGPSRRNDQLDAPTIGSQRLDHRRLAGVQVEAVGGGFDEAEVDRNGVEGVPVNPVGSVEEALFGGQDPHRGVLLGPGDGEHRRPI